MMEVQMKSIILILVSMVILSGCGFDGLNIRLSGGGGDGEDYFPHPLPPTKEVYKAVVKIETENGDPCTESCIYLVVRKKSYYSNPDGFVTIEIELIDSSTTLEDYRTYWFIIYKDDTYNVSIECGIKLKLLEEPQDFPTYTIVIPDSL
jgi:hypothetical protein